MKIPQQVSPLSFEILIVLVGVVYLLFGCSKSIIQTELPINLTGEWKFKGEESDTIGTLAYIQQKDIFLDLRFKEQYRVERFSGFPFDTSFTSLYYEGYLKRDSIILFASENGISRSIKAHLSENRNRIIGVHKTHFTKYRGQYGVTISSPVVLIRPQDFPSTAQLP